MLFQRFFIVLMLLCASAQAMAQFTIRGTITETETGLPLADAAVSVNGTDKFAATDEKGQFFISGLKSGKITLVISHNGFITQTQTLELGAATKEQTVLIIDMERDPALPTIPSQTTSDIPTVTLEEAEDDTEGAGEVANVLNSSRDVLQNIASFGWSTFRFRERGYDGGLFQTFVNGVPFNDFETGFTAFGELGGLNDVLRLRTSTVGLDPAEFAFTGVGGGTFIDARASSQRKQTRISYASSNRTWRNRVTATMSSGLMPRGWAVTASFSRRWAQEGYVEGTYFDAYSYFLGIEKKFSKKHALGLTVFGAPTKRGRSADSFQEMFDLAGSNYYNPLWGYWNGEKRNSSGINNHQPMAILRYDWTPSTKTNLLFAAYAQTGRNDFSRINFLNARNPNPDFNRRLPSSLESPEMAALQAQELSSDPNFRQLDWSAIYQANQLSFRSIEDANGQAGNTVSGKNSLYIIENQRSQNTEYGANLIFNQSISSRIAFNGGAMYQSYTGKNFKEVDDLLGGDYWVDWDFFGNFDGAINPLARNSDIRTPNKIIKEGERFGWDYDEHINKANAWGQVQFSLPRFQFFVGGEGGQQTMWRTGYMQNGRFPNSSLGESEKVNFTTYAVKGGATWKVNGRNYFYANAYQGTRAPLYRNTFFQARTRDLVVPNIEPSLTRSIEGGYLWRNPRFKARVSGYLTEFKNETELTFASAWTVGGVIRELDLSNLGIGEDDLSLEQPIFFGTTILQGQDRRHTGIEAALEAKPFASWVFTGAVSLGQYIYTNRPQILFSLDNGSATVPVIPGGISYQENFNVPRTPQTAGTVGIKYEGKKFWFASLSLNYAANSWYDFDRVRRTSRFVSGLNDTDPIWRTVVDQQKAPSAYTVDFFGGKSWKITRGEKSFFMYLTLGVSNLLNNQNIVLSGREAYRNAFRRDFSDPRFYTSEVLYAFGTNYFASVTFRL